MKEQARLERNEQRLTECFPIYGAQVRKTLDQLEAEGFRPRIQDAWRSVEDQLKAFNKGVSQTKFGFHNATGGGGAKEALACDILDDDNPLTPRTSYLLALARAARANGLSTGILWGLKPPLVAGVEAALAAGDLQAPVKVGWDPCHVEVVGLSTTRVKRGERPSGTGNVGRAGPSPVRLPTGAVHVVQSGDTLGRIAKANGLTLAELLALNPQFVPNPNLIHVGDEVRLA